MSGINVHLEISERFRDVSAAVLAAIEGCLDLVAQELWGQVKTEAPVDHGRLAGSFMTSSQSALSRSVYTNVEYALDVHEGRDPGPVDFGAIERWAGRKGLPAGAVYRTIREHGTRPNRYADRAVESTETRVEEFAQMAVERAAQEFNL